MAKTIGQLKTTISSRLHGTTLNKLSDFYTLCRDTAEIVLARIDLQEARRRALLVNAVYDQVYDYQLPTDFKAPINLLPQTGPYNFSDNSSLSRTYSTQFNNQKQNNQYALIWQDAIQFMRFARFINIPAILDKADSLTENGTWTVGGNASALVVDTLNFIAGIGSLKATISSPGVVSSITMRLGIDSSDYYSKTITTGHFEAFQTGWNLCRFNLSDAILTGSVNMAAIKYLRFTVTYNSGQTAYFEKTLTNAVDLSGNYLSSGSIFTYLNFNTVSSLSFLNIDNITANLGTLYDLDYYSNYMFRTVAGSWIDIPTFDTDILNLSPISYQIFEAELSKLIAQQVEGSMGLYDDMYWTDKLEGDGEHEGLYAKYETLYPSERMEAQTDYYNITDDFDLDDGTLNGLPISYFN